MKPDGVFLSNGPGDPEPCDYAIAATRTIIETGTPTFGICLGHQIMALASGAKTFKMKFGHHGANHPVKESSSGRVSITSQNHGFAVDAGHAAGQPRGHARLAVRRHAAGPGPHRQAGVLLPGPPGSLARPARHRLPVRPVHRFDGRRERRRRTDPMPKRTDLKSVLIIGAGPIIIGQACEFDYSGAQACKALREEGYKVILVNSNPATIMTDPATADVTYIEPITWQVVEKIIEKERPDAILPTMGGQTALNCALDLHKHGVLDKYKRRDDRRQRARDREGRGPPEVQGRDDQDRPGLGQVGHRALDGRGAGPCRSASPPRSTARASRW